MKDRLPPEPLTPWQQHSATHKAMIHECAGPMLILMEKLAIGTLTVRVGRNGNYEIEIVQEEESDSNVACRCGMVAKGFRGAKMVDGIPHKYAKCPKCGRENIIGKLNHAKNVG